MNQKNIGIVVIVIALVLGFFVYTSQERYKQSVDLIIEQQNGSCYLEDGTCLHDASNKGFVLGWVLVSALIILGIYLMFFDKTQQLLAKNQVVVSEALKEAKEKEKEKDKFNAFLSGFSEDEQKIIKAIKEQEGIQQSTLRFRVGMAKASLSVMLKSLEEKNIISRKPEGKTNKIFLIKKF